MSPTPDVVVLGAGPAGLAMGGALRQRGVSFVVLEREERVGNAWRNHYERLHLHTVKQHSALPGMPWPEHVPMYPARQDVVDYLEAYAKRFDVEARFGETVSRVHRDGHRWTVTHSSGSTSAKHVVIATGYNRAPKIPTWPGTEGFTGEIVHSSQYRDGRAWRGKSALVVGAGNSGAEIALDLWEWGARTALCIRGPIHVVPRDVMGIPAQVNSLRVMSRLPPWLADRISLAMLDRVVGDLSPWGIHRPKLGPVTQVLTEGRIPLIDVGTVKLIKQGKITVVPGITRFTEKGVVFDDGRALDVDLVVLATGYRAALDGFLDHFERYVDERGYPRAHGADAPEPGLYFIGYRNPLTGAFHDIARQAEAIATRVARSP